MNERQQERLDDLLVELSTLKQEATELHHAIMNERSKIETMRVNVMENMNRLANISRDIEQIKYEMHSLEGS